MGRQYKFVRRWAVRSNLGPMGGHHAVRQWVHHGFAHNVNCKIVRCGMLVAVSAMDKRSICFVASIKLRGHP